MKIAVIGAGAMGALYAGLLCEAGHEVWAVDIRADHIDAINSRGLRITGASGERTVRGIHATTNLEAVGACDLYIIATKADGVGAAASGIAGLAGPQSLVLTIQNGLGAGERIARYMDTKNVLLGVAEGFGAALEGPGHTHHNGMSLIRIGEMGGGVTERAEAVARVWEEAGFTAKVFGDITQLIWEKWVCNCTYSAPCAVFGCTIGELQANAANFAIALGCAREAHALGVARGVNFSFGDPVEYVTAFGARMPGSVPSLAQDVQHGRRSEIDAINGMAATLGAEMGIPAPYNETLSAIVRAREAAY